MSTEEEMLRNSELMVEKEKVKSLRFELEFLREFANWMASRHDFSDSHYFEKNKFLLNKRQY